MISWRGIVFVTAITIAVHASTLAAQLRPLEPIPWRLFDETTSLSGELGGARLFDQRASLAGSTGDLWELLTFAFGWRTGRVVLEAAGTGFRIFRERSHFAALYPGVDAAEDGRRHDSGDYRISTTVRLTPTSSQVTAALRFGTRLPTTDNTTGLDRDAVDFFATAGAASDRGPLSLSGEAGLGIHTTREEEFEQDDLFLYALRAEYRTAIVTPGVAMLGQMHGTTHSAIRGVENLGELRLGLRAGGRRWIRGEVVKGYETFSPSWGFIVTAGVLR
ncbi:MAG: hypothetical protein ABI681_06250 [Gemmatimonadales bacterium]